MFSLDVYRESVTTLMLHKFLMIIKVTIAQYCTVHTEWLDTYQHHCIDSHSQCDGAL